MLVGEALREARGAAGISQESVAAAAGIDRAYLSLVERDRVSPTLRVLSRICAALDVRPSTIIARAERQQRPIRANRSSPRSKRS